MKKKKKLFGGEIAIITDESETAGLFDLLQITFQPGVEVPLHQHNRYSETVFLQSGRLTILLKNKQISLQPGDHFVIPKDTPHVVINGNELSVATVICAPSGFAGLVKTAGVDPASKEEVDMELFKKLCDELGDILLGPPGSRP